MTAELEQSKQEIQRLSELVSTDPLTNLFNFRHFSHELKQEFERSQRTLQPTALIMLDVDYFKKVNDQWGHEVGNLALKLIASCIIKNVRKLDIACRYGGEEFAIILPSSDIATSARVAERIRKSIEASHLTFTKTDGTQELLTLTVSAGLSIYTGNTTLVANSLIAAADEQLYQAKNQGRNQVCYETQEMAEQQVSEEEKSALFTMFDNSEP